MFRANPFGGATIEISEGQRVIASGPYAIVRHPMYSWALIMLVGVPLALGSWAALVMLGPALLAIVWRLLDEERLLTKKLPGYADYQRKVGYRLIPYVW